MVYDLQIANFWKRISAWLFDSILIVILAVGAAFLFSSILGYDDYTDQISDAYARYESEFGISLDISEEEYLSLPTEKQQAFDAARTALTNDEDSLYAYNMVINLTLLISSLSILASILVAEFILPLFFKNGRTLGKKIFGLCVVRTDCVQINTPQLFIRAILGKFAVETMIPVYLIFMIFWGIIGLGGTLILIFLLVSQSVSLILTRHKALIHDFLAGTAVVDYSSQMIFKDSQELTAFQKKVHRERAEKQKY